MPGSYENQGDGGSFVVSQLIRNGKHVHARDGDVFGVAAIVQVTEHAELRAQVLLARGAGRAHVAECHGRQQYALTWFEIGDVFAELGDRSGDVAAVDVRQLDSRQALADEEIQMIQGHRLDLYQNLVLAKLRLRHIFKFQHLRPAKLMNSYRFHGKRSPCRLGSV